MTVPCKSSFQRLGAVTKSLRQATSSTLRERLSSFQTNVSVPSLLHYREAVVQCGCRTVADPYVEVGRFCNPSVLCGAPVGSLPGADREADLLFLPRLQRDTTEPLQLTNRSRCRTESLMEINLHHFVGCSCASICNRDRCRDRSVKGSGFSA